MKAVPVPLALIRITPDSQSRSSTDRRTVKEYADAWQAEAEFPPVDLFTQGGEYYPGDGIHRILAAKLARRSAILAYVYRGGTREAFLHACASNQKHGLRRTNKDKRHMVGRMLNDVEWVKWSDRRIAEQCGVSAQFVANVRHELSTVDGTAASRFSSQPRLGADGKLRRPPRLNGSGAQSSKCRPLNGANGWKKGIYRTQRRDSLNVDTFSAQRIKAADLVRQLSQILRSLELYESCTRELQTISKRLDELSVTGMSA